MSAATSSTPATVTVCALSQSPAVNVRVSWAPGVPASVSTVPSAGSVLATSSTTAPNGSLARRTVNVAVPPASVVTSPADGDATTPASSSSTLVSDTSSVSPAPSAS